MIPSRIQLRLIGYQGQPLAHTWAQVQAQVHDPLAVHQAQDLTLELPLALADGSAVAVLAWSGVGWILKNQTQTLYLYINQEPLAPGLARHIDMDDVLEIGLCRFVVEAADQVWYPPKPNPSPATDAAALSADTPAWDALHAAAAPLGVAALDAADPFDLVPMLDLSAQPSASAASATSAQSQLQAESDLLGELGHAYYKALHDPQSALGQTRFVSREQEIDLGPTRNFEQEALDNNNPISLEDIIQSPPNIATLLERFYAPGEHELFKPEQHEDVLWLFATEADRRGVATRRALAPRTRQDHHSMSIDSSYHLGAPTPRSRGDVAP